MIERIHLKFGPFGTVKKLEFCPSAMTVFVGPNNSGKSLVLRELLQNVENGPTASRQILEGIELKLLPDDELDSMLEARRVEMPENQVLSEGHVRFGKTIPTSGSLTNIDLHTNTLKEQIKQSKARKEAGDCDWWKACWQGIYTHFASLFAVSLDGKTRLSLTDPRKSGDLLAAPANHLIALFQDAEARKRVRDIGFEAFGLYFVIDPTNSGNLRIRMSSRAPADELEEQALDTRARSFHSAAKEISALSDGVKAFIGLISALISSDYRIMLVDEPEAFLHPPLASQLGREMATISDMRKANVFAATHSSRFLMGCVESGKRLNIVRLTYNASQATARLLEADKIEELLRDPLLRSAGVLDALFYSAAIVCEADRDRVFYSEINNRMQVEGHPNIRDAVFLNAQNKQTIRRIVGPLRSMGIPAAAVVDLDIIKGSDLRDLLNACFVPEGLAQSLGQLRGNVEASFRVQGGNMKKGGITLLEGEARESCQSMLRQLAEYGIFVVPKGEVETWLGYLEVEVAKENWLPAIFERMKTDQADPDYVRPQGGDVWQFIEDVRIWIQNESRHGMPRPSDSPGQAAAAAGNPIDAAKA